MAIFTASFAGTLHIIAGETTYKIGGTVTTISNGKIIVKETTIIASNIIISGKKNVDGSTSWNSAYATGNVVVILKDATITAEKMHYNLNSDNGVLSGNASMTVVSGKEKISVLASTLNFDTKRKFYTGEGSPVYIEKGKTHIEGKNFTYDAAKKIFNVYNDVYLYNSSNNEKAWSEGLIMNVDENTIVLKKVRMEIMIKN